MWSEGPSAFSPVSVVLLGVQEVAGSNPVGPTICKIRRGIEKRVHAHGLRHTGAAELAREGKPMNLIQAQLGHSNLGTTDRYIRHIAPQELIEAMQRREWNTETSER